ncbi:MAG: tetratricopeptide repeat protein, partial [Gemmataceae bacterium]
MRTIAIPLGLLLLVLPSVSALAQDPGDLYKQAEELNRQDRPAAAEAIFRKVVDGADPFFRRQAYERLLSIYVKSSRLDKAVQLANEYHDWLSKVGDQTAANELEVAKAECFFGLGYTDKAEALFQEALTAKPVISVEKRLQALHGLALLADDRRNAPLAKTRWEMVEASARDAADIRTKKVEFVLRTKATRLQAEALHVLGRDLEATEVLRPLLAQLTKSTDLLARRDTLRQQANLLAFAGKFTEAEPVFTEALKVHREYRVKKRLPAGDIL